MNRLQVLGLVAACLAVALNAHVTTAISAERAGLLRFKMRAHTRLVDSLKASDTDTPVKMGDVKVHSEKPMKVHFGEKFDAVSVKGDDTVVKGKVETGAKDGAAGDAAAGDAAAPKKETEADIEKETEMTEGDDQPRNGDANEDAAGAMGDAGGDKADVKAGAMDVQGGTKVVDEQHPATPLVDEATVDANNPQAAAQQQQGDCAVKPCDGLNGRYKGLKVAHVVEKLSTNAKSFKPEPKKPVRDSLWDELNSVDGTDKTQLKRKAQLKQLEQKMLNARNWIKEVHMIINHYQKQIGNVAMGLKYEAQDAKHIKDLILARRRILERKRLERKLQMVNKRIQKVEEKARETGSHSESLTDLRAHLQRKISSLQSQIGQQHAEGSIFATPFN